MRRFFKAVGFFCGVACLAILLLMAVYPAIGSIEDFGHYFMIVFLAGIGLFAAIAWLYFSREKLFKLWRNKSAKSTLISFFENPDSGKILVRGGGLTEFPRAATPNIFMISAEDVYQLEEYINSQDVYPRLRRSNLVIVIMVIGLLLALGVQIWTYNQFVRAKGLAAATQNEMKKVLAEEMSVNPEDFTSNQLTDLAGLRIKEAEAAWEKAEKADYYENMADQALDTAEKIKALKDEAEKKITQLESELKIATSKKGRK